MGYSKKVYSLARAFLNNLRNENIKDYETRRRYFRSKFLRGAKIEDEIARTALFAARAVLSGKDVKKQLTELKNSNEKLKYELSIVLKDAGLSQDYLKIKYNCAKCSDTGYINGVMCGCFKKILRTEAYNSLSRLSPLSLCSFCAFSLDYYDECESREKLVNIQGMGNGYIKTKMKKIFDYCVGYASSFSTSSENLFMVGETGLGKTHLSLAIANDVIKKGFGVVYVSVPNIISKIERERFRYSSEENTELHLVECDLLILDDLGTEFRTQFSVSTIYNIINSRILCSRPTIISTNCSLNIIESDYSRRLVSRLWGNYRLLNFCGRDIRAEKASRKVRAERGAV